MAVPNHQHIVDRVYAAGSFDLRTREGCGTLVEAACVELHRADPRWGHLKKHPGQTQYNGHSHDGTLYLSDTPGQSVHVDFIAGAEGPNPSITWNPDVPRYSKSDWYAPEVTPPPPSSTCHLGCTLFWAMAGLRSHEAKLRRNLAWLRDVLGADYVRVFAVVGGDLFSGVDPWRDAGAFRSWADWRVLMGQLTDLCHDDYGLRVEWTLFGGRAQVPTLVDCEQVIADWLHMAAPRLGKIALVEVWNEYNINGGTSSELRHLARRLRAGLPASVPIALSSPGTVHACATDAEIHAEVAKLHDGLSEATAITPHWCRAHHVAPSLGPSAPRLRYSNEPRGPGASAGGGDVDDPALLASDYRAAIAAGYAGYVYHPLGGIWGGLCHGWPDQNRWPDVWSSPGASATAAQLRAIRHGSAPPVDPPLPPIDPPPVPPVDPPPPEPPPVGDVLASGASLTAGDERVSQNGRFVLAYQGDGNLVLYLTRPAGDRAIWHTATEGHPPGEVAMQAIDGNLVVYDAAGTAVWAAGSESPGARLLVQNDGNAVVYAADGASVWSTGTVQETT
jgi:hypothetical protein